MGTSENDDIDAAFCVVRDLWPDLIVDVGRNDGQVEIRVDAELAPQVRPGQPAPLLKNQTRAYPGRTWQEAIRAAGKGEGVRDAKVEDRIATMERAIRESRTVYFTPMD